MSVKTRAQSALRVLTAERPAWPGSLAQRWSRFWFQPTSTSTLGLLRIAFASVVVAWALTLLADAGSFYSPQGLVAGRSVLPWSILGDHAAVGTGLILVLICAAAAMAVGWHSRLASVLVFAGLLFLQRRNGFIFNTGDSLLRHIAFYLMLAPTGAALSLDRWQRAREAFWTCPARAPWAVRLLQVQLSVIYVSTVWDKWAGATWREGTALHYVVRIADLSRFPVPQAVADSELALALATYGTLGLEVAVALLIWNRRALPWVAAAGLAMHAGIALTLRVGFFSLAMACLYLAFVPPDTVDELVGRLRRRWRHPASRQAVTAPLPSPPFIAVIEGLKADRPPADVQTVIARPDAEKANPS